MFMKDVIAVRAVQDNHLELEFEDGVKGVIDIRKAIRGFDGVFAPLRNPEFFRQVRLAPELGTICWPNGADLDPDMLYALTAGQPLLVGGERVFN
ncbi:MAG: DUF2442 domain-containing protein [Rhodocyclaceae bacterium]|nr:DUF2442 domain-containing protein [Rhodocyclaceae bacterium]